MTESALELLRWGIRLIFVLGSVIAFTVFMATVTGMLITGFNGSILGEIMGIVQIWLPFNLSAIMMWLTTATALYFTYRLSLIALNFVQNTIGRE